jgi:hypothetical protein
MADITPWIDNTNTLNFYVRDQVTIPEPDLSTATITFSIKSTDGLTTLTSGTMTYKTIIRKRNRIYYLYQATIAHTVSFAENTLYYLDITLSYNSTQGYWSNLRVKPLNRSFR